MKPLPATRGGNKKVSVETKMTPPSDPQSISRPAPPTSASLSTTMVTLQPTPAEGKGRKGVTMMSRLFDKSCDETLCPADSFCVNDYTWGGSRCHCNLGKGGESCSDGRCSRKEHVSDLPCGEPDVSTVVQTWFLLFPFVREALCSSLVIKLAGARQIVE